MGLLLLSANAELNPRTLFANNEQGLWLDPSQMSTLYQDSNGVTPCTAAGDPVGLILDQSRGGLGALGSELLADTGFDSAGSWDASAGVTVSGGVAAWNTAGTSVYVRQENIITQNRWYLVEIDCSSYTSGEVRFAYGAGGSSVAATGATVTKTGLVRFIFFSSAGSGRAWLLTPAGGAVLSVTRFSVREVPGNHASQSSSSARPTLARIPSSGRRNVLIYSEQLDNAAWVKLNATATANATTAPDGTATADSFIGSGVANAQRVSQTVTATGSHTFSIYAKANTHNFIQLFQNSDGEFYANFDLSDGTIGNKGTKTTASITSVGNGWYRLVVSWAIVTSGPHSMHLVDSKTASYAANSATANSLYLWGAQLETGSSATNYQKVGSTHDVTESGVGDLWFLSFDGSDDSLSTNAVDFATWTQETRRNLLIDTENFGAATWSKSNGATASGNVITFVNANSYVQQNIVGFGATLTATLRFKASVSSGTTTIRARLADGADGTPSNTVDCVLTTTPTYFTNTAVFTTNFSGTLAVLLNGDNVVAPGSVVTVEEMQLELGSTATTYQRVGTDEMTVIAGVRKLSDAARGMVVELGSDTVNSFQLNAPPSASARYSFGSRGSALASAETPGSSYPSPVTNVLAGVGDISEDTAILRINGAQAVSSATDQGSGNYGNYALYIGRRGGTTLPYNGHLYQLIIRGKTTPTGKLLEAERFTARKTGVSF